MENKSLKQIIANRLEKLDKIRQLGVNPYPYEFNITHSTSEITKDNIDQNVSVAGRVMSLRKMGKAAFANIQDEKEWTTPSRREYHPRTCCRRRQS